MGSNSSLRDVLRELEQGLQQMTNNSYFPAYLKSKHQNITCRLLNHYLHPKQMMLYQNTGPVWASSFCYNYFFVCIHKEGSPNRAGISKTTNVRWQQSILNKKIFRLFRKGATTLSMMTFSIMTLSIMTFSITINKN